MTTETSWNRDLVLDIEHGYLWATEAAPRHNNPVVVLNDGGVSALRAIRDELTRADRITFSVAFVSPQAIALLIQELRDFTGEGCIVTSTYLGFNSPAAFSELLKLRHVGIDVRLHPAPGFHPKGYIFERPGAVTAMVGSSNLTHSALVTNHEWNLKVTAAAESDLGRQFADLAAAQRQDSIPLTQAWIDEYAATYREPPAAPPVLSPSASPGEESPSDPQQGPGRSTIEPNAMQLDALASLAQARSEKEPRALIISATGTGKTILSALDVRAVNPQRLLFVVHREQILDRTIQEYRAVLGGPVSDYGKLTGTSKNTSAKYLFATVQTLSQPSVLESFEPEAFDYVVFDEAHRAAAAGHRRVIDYLKPRFLLGMTATPERPDGFNVFELFNYVVPYEIRLTHALDAAMLAPFHYYGISDVVYADGSTTDDFTDLAQLASPERIDHLIGALTIYGQAGVAPRGLIFGRSKAEVHALSRALNQRDLRGRRLRTVALTGDHTVSEREHAVRQFEAGAIDYLLTVDIFNEGVDIPSVNQVVMLRQTQSAIVFVQQLGRGLRKAHGKDYLVVLDFIGNYANNFLIPVALFGNESLNKESLRQEMIAAEEAGVLAGLSSVRFDQVSQERVLRSITDTSLDSINKLRTAIVAMQNRVGTDPSLWDFFRFESVDPVLLATKKEHFPALLAATLRSPNTLTTEQGKALQLVSHEVFTARRLHEFVILSTLLEGPVQTRSSLAQACGAHGLRHDGLTIDSAIDTFTLAGHAEVDLKRYGSPIVEVNGDQVALTQNFRDHYTSNPQFRLAIDDLLRTGQALVSARYDTARALTPGRQYGRKEVTRLLGMPRKWTSTLYGYKAFEPAKVCPLFVTLHKDAEVTASTAYEDALIDRQTMVWFTKSQRTLASPLEGALVRNEYWLPVFVKKDDAEGSEFYYLGDATVFEAHDTTMTGNDGKLLPVVRTELRFARPIDSALFDYFHPTLT